MSKLVILCLLSIILISCGQQGSDSGAKKVIRYNSLSMNPIVLEKSNRYCDRILAQDEDALFTVQRLLNTRVIQRDVDLSNSIDMNTLVDKNKQILTDHIINYSSQRIFKATVYSENQYDIHVDTDEVTDSGMSNTICPTRMSYPRKSAENAGILIMNTLLKTYDALDDFAKAKLSSIKLILTPKDYSEYIFYDYSGEIIQSQKGYMVDNAYYHPLKEEIVFLPQSKEGVRLGLFGKPFWEVPMVASHEYGHHIFNKLYPNFSKESKKEVMIARECFDNRLHGELGYFMSAKKRVVNRDYIHSSFNEGFADLVAKYSLSNEENNISDINCFKKNREIHVGVFADGTPKVFNSQNMYKIFQGVKVEVRSCNTTNFQDNHIVGAVFAHSIDQIYTSYGLSSKEKLSMLLNWINTLNDSAELNSLNAKSYLKRSIELLIDDLYFKYGEDNKKIIKKYFSFL